MLQSIRDLTEFVLRPVDHRTPVYASDFHVGKAVSLERRDLCGKALSRFIRKRGEDKSFISICSFLMKLKMAFAIPFG